MAIRVKDIMEKDTFILRDTDNIGKALSFLYNKEVSGVPVVNAFNEVVGYISDGDILYYVARKKPYAFEMAGEIASIAADVETFDERISDLFSKNVMDIASRKIVTVNENTEVDLVAEILSKKKYSKIAIVDDDEKIVGIVTRWHIVSHIFENMLAAAGETDL